MPSGHNITIKTIYVWEKI